MIFDSIYKRFSQDIGIDLGTANSHFDKVLDHFREELSALRTGRASSGILSTVMVESYGTKLPLQQVASITVSDAKTLVVGPYDVSQMQAIEKAIQSANLGLNPSNDGKIIRLILPPLNEERRKEMVKLLGQMVENARIGIRQVREEILKVAKREEADGKATKDDVASTQKKVQEIVDDYNQKVKELAEGKEKEIMTV